MLNFAIGLVIGIGIGTLVAILIASGFIRAIQEAIARGLGW